MTNETYILIGVIGLFLTIIAWISYLDFRVHLLEAKLNLSEFELEKNTNEKTIKSMSKPALDAALNGDIGRGSSGPSEAPVLLPSDIIPIADPSSFPDSIEHS